MDELEKIDKQEKINMNRKIGENSKIALNDIMKSSLLMFLEKKNNSRMDNQKIKKFW